MLQGHKGLMGTKLGLDENLTPMQQVRKSKMRPLFKEAKAADKRTCKLFINDIQICPPSSV
jgi:hypothetical protein